MNIIINGGKSSVRFNCLDSFKASIMNITIRLLPQNCVDIKITTMINFTYNNRNDCVIVGMEFNKYNGLPGLYTDCEIWEFMTDNFIEIPFDETDLSKTIETLRKIKYFFY
jgi:hypothetical protein